MTVALRARLGAAVATAPSVTTGSISYASTLDAGLTDLHAHYAYDSEKASLPIVVIMHGFADEASDVASAIMEDMAEYGFFALAVGMRGRDAASGTPDVSGRELHDIIDAVEYVKSNHASVVDGDRVHLAGYSGGGGNALALAAKAPDYFTVLASHFGISDYGYDATYGWGEQETSRQEQLADWVSYRARSGWAGTEDVNLDAYRSRNTIEAIALNRTGGHLYLFHDDQDSVVDVTQSSRVKDAFDAESNTAYTYDETTTGDDPRWEHDLPHPDGDPEGPSGGAPVRHTRDTWGPPILNETVTPWTVSETGNARVIGYMITKRFEIWLGDGTEHVADLTYDTTTGEYTVTPLTGEVEVTITQGDRTAIETTDSATTIRLDYVHDAFTDADDTNLAAHSPDTDAEGGGWGLAQGTYEIQSDRAARNVTTADVTDGISIDAGVAEHVLRAKVRTGTSTGPAGVTTRAADQNNHFWAGINSDLDTLLIIERTSGSATIVESAAHAFSAETTFDLKVTTTATSITIEVDGETLVHGSTSKNTNTRVGIATPSTDATVESEDAERWWDDFRVSPLPPQDTELATWQDGVNVTTSPGEIQKTGGSSATWDAGARSVQEIASGGGSVTAELLPGGATRNLIFGLADADPDQDFASIKHGLFLGHNSGDVFVFESGTNEATVTTWADGDEFTIELDGGTVNYKKNGTTVHTSTSTLSYPVFVDVSIYEDDAGLQGVTLTGDWA